VLGLALVTGVNSIRQTANVAFCGNSDREDEGQARQLYGVDTHGSRRRCLRRAASGKLSERALHLSNRGLPGHRDSMQPGC